MNQAFVVVSTDDYRLVTVGGEIDGASAVPFRLACTSTMPVVVDLSGCSYIDSNGLSALIAASRIGSMALILSRASRIYRIFEVTQLLEHFVIAATFEEALALIVRAPGTEPVSDVADL